MFFTYESSDFFSAQYAKMYLAMTRSCGSIHSAVCGTPQIYHMMIVSKDYERHDSMHCRTY